jgi:hypothetical protein
LGGTKTAISGLRVIQLLNAVAHGNDNFWYVAGDNGAFYANPLSSTGLQKGSDYNARGICIGGYNDYGGRYIATCGAGGIIRATTSVWLSSFSTVSTGTTNDLNSIVYENGKYVAVGDGGTILVSTNISAGFSKVSSGTTGNLTRVKCCNGYFIALGDGVILHSQNGTTWTLMRDVYGIPFTDAAFSSGRYLIAAKDGNNGLLFTSEYPLDTFMAFEMAWYVGGKPLLTISPLENTVIIAGGGGYAAVGTYTGYGPQFFEFEELETGTADDIKDMVWTDAYVGAVVGENGCLALNRFPGGAGVALKYEPIPVATISSVGLIRPDNETTSVDRDGRLSAIVANMVPSTQTVTLTVSSSGSKYTAPADGWVTVSGSTAATNAFILLEVKDSTEEISLIRAGETTYSSGRVLQTFVPVASGNKFVLTYDSINFTAFKFVYSQGAL